MPLFIQQAGARPLPEREQSQIIGQQIAAISAFSNFYVGINRLFPIPSLQQARAMQQELPSVFQQLGQANFLSIQNPQSGIITENARIEERQWLALNAGLEGAPLVEDAIRQITAGSLPRRLMNPQIGALALEAVQGEAAEIAPQQQLAIRLLADIAIATLDPTIWAGINSQTPEDEVREIFVEQAELVAQNLFGISQAELEQRLQNPSQIDLSRNITLETVALRFLTFREQEQHTSGVTSLVEQVDRELTTSDRLLRVLDRLGTVADRIGPVRDIRGAIQRVMSGEILHDVSELPESVRAVLEQEFPSNEYLIHPRYGIVPRTPELTQVGIDLAIPELLNRAGGDPRRFVNLTSDAILEGLTTRFPDFFRQEEKQHGDRNFAQVMRIIGREGARIVAAGDMGANIMQAAVDSLVRIFAWSVARAQNPEDPASWIYNSMRGAIAPEAVIRQLDYGLRDAYAVNNLSTKNKRLVDVRDPKSWFKLIFESVPLEQALQKNVWSILKHAGRLDPNRAFTAVGMTVLDIAPAPVGVDLVMGEVNRFQVAKERLALALLQEALAGNPEVINREELIARAERFINRQRRHGIGRVGQGRIAGLDDLIVDIDRQINVASAEVHRLNGIVNRDGFVFRRSKRRRELNAHQSTLTKRRRQRAIAGELQDTYTRVN